MTVRVTLVRHGRTAWNAERRLLGWTDLPLDHEGAVQAVELGVRVGRAVHDTVWTSDLQRATETARLAGWAPYAIDHRLREIDFGELEGRTWSELEPSVRDALVAFDGFVAPGGESTAGLVERATDFLDDLDTGTHRIVTHGGVIRALLRVCGETGAFPDHGAVYTLDWRRRVLLEVQLPTV